MRSTAVHMATPPLGRQSHSVVSAQALYSEMELRWQCEQHRSLPCLAEGTDDPSAPTDLVLSLAIEMMHLKFISKPLVS